MVFAGDDIFLSWVACVLIIPFQVNCMYTYLHSPRIDLVLCLLLRKLLSDSLNDSPGPGLVFVCRHRFRQHIGDWMAKLVALFRGIA